MESKISEFIPLSLKSFAEDADYFAYISMELGCMDIDESKPVIFCSKFLFYQTPDHRMEFIKINPVRAEWTIEMVKQFCKRLEKSRAIQPFDRFLSFQQATRGKSEDLEEYVKRLSKMLRDLPAKPEDALIMFKLLGETTSKVKEQLCSEESIDLDKVVKLWGKDIKTEVIKSKLNGWSHPKPYGNSITTVDKSKPHTFETKRWTPNATSSVPNTYQNRTSEVKMDARPKECEKTNQAPSQKIGSVEVPSSLRTTPLIFEAFRIFSQDVVCMLDTGATNSILTKSTIDRCNWSFIKEEITAIAFDSSSAKILGYMDASITTLTSDVRYQERFYIVENGVNIVTSTVCHELSINISARIEEIAKARKDVITKIEEISEYSTELAECLLENHQVWDESPMKAITQLEIPLLAEPERNVIRSYPQKGSKKAFLAETLMKDIREGRIVQTFDPKLSSPVHVVGKEKLRLVIDGTRVNKSVAPIKVALPTMNEIQAKLSGATRFYTFDFQAAYKSFELFEDQTYIQTFSTQFGYYKSTAINFGYSYAGQLFMLEMQKLIHQYGIEKLVMFVDDSLFGGSEDADLESEVIKFIKMCKHNGLKLNLLKSRFNEPAAKFLGATIDKNGISVDHSRHMELMKIERPRNREEARRVLGKFGYIQKFISGYSSFSSKLYPKDAGEYIWNDAKEEAWLGLLQSCNDYITLHFPPEDVQLTLEYIPTESCLHCHMYFVESEERKMVDVFMRKLTPSEDRYSAIEKELLSLATAIEKNSYISKGWEIVIHTRSKAVESLLKQDLGRVVEESSRIQRLVAPIILSGWTVKFVQDKWKSLIPREVKINALCIARKKKFEFVSELELEEIAKFQEEDEICNGILAFLNGEEPSAELQKKMDTDELSLEDGMIHVAGKILISKDLASKAAKIIHSNTHAGATTMHEHLKSVFSCRGMSTIVTQEVAGCELCAKCKKNPARKFVKWTRARYPREMGSFDLCYVDSKCIIVFVDHYSSYTYGAILKSKNQENLINFFTGIFQEHPFTLVISDGEPSLNSEGLNQFFKNSKIGLYQNGKSEEMGTERVTTPKYHPSSNGRIEGRIQDVKTKMQIAKLENKCVSEQLSFALASLNNMPAAWTDEEGNLKRSTPAQRYFVNDEVRPSRWNNEVVDCSPSQIYFKPRGHLSKMFELGSKVGELGDSIYLIQDQRGENHLVSRNFTKAVISRADPSMESTDSIEARRRETKPSAEQEIPEASSSITTDEELYMLLEALVNGDKAFMVVDGSASNKKELEKSTEEKYHGVAGVGFVNAPVAFRKRNFLRGRTTAPRMEAVAALEACAIAMDARVKDLTLISDCEYVVKGIRNNTYKEWLNDKSTPHSSTWKELDKHVKRGLNIETIHITAHSISLHNLVDAMARGEDIEGWIVKLKPGVEKCGVGLEEIRACYK